MLTLNLRAIAAAVHRLLRLLVCLIAYSINIHTYFNGSCMRKFQKEKNYYKNNRGSFWELENRIMGRKKRIMCGCLLSEGRGDMSETWLWTAASSSSSSETMLSSTDVSVFSCE